jgi:P-type Mg2+ transporter
MKALIRRLTSFEVHTDDIESAVFSTYGDLIEAALKHPDAVMQHLNTSSDGLADHEAKNRLERYGKNLIAHEKSLPWYRQLLRSFLDPFIGVLVIIGMASFITEFLVAEPNEKSLVSVVIIGILVLISVLLSFFQEYQANRAAEQLLALVKKTAIVFRKNLGQQNLPTEVLVPGDIIHLSAGDIIPADVRLFNINNLSVNEAALTGESLPVDKLELHGQGHVQADHPYDAHSEINPLDLENLGYQGTNVVSGSSQAIVLATGHNTYLGAMSEHLVGHHPASSFEKGVRSVSLLLIRFMLVMVPVIFLINGITRGDWLQALLFGLAVAVGLTPEMLPTIVTVNLAKGSIEMARKKTVVKRLNAIQNLGAMDVLCTDKTGTLTEDSVALETYQNLTGEKDETTFKYTFLNSHFQSGLKNPLDDAVLAHPDAHTFSNIEADYTKIGEIPFETTRRRMSVIVRDGTGDSVLICKGALDEMLAITSSIRIENKVQVISKNEKIEIRSMAEDLINNGLRILLVGIKRLKPQQETFSKTDEADLTLIGLIGFLDPPKETSGEAIKNLNGKGVLVLVITGDNEIATRRVCQEIGFNITGLVEGYQVEQMQDQELQQILRTSNVFVRTTPIQKSRIINMIKAMGHTVGFLGDGINDAIALRDADVGISVDNAVDIAKESADILLLEKSLMVLEEGVARGRLVFGNMMKYIKMTISSNFGNVFSVLVASIILPFPPMLPLHLLIQNLLYDISQLSIPWDDMDEDYLKKPRRWDPKSITRFTLFLGPVSSLFDFSTFALLWFILGANSPERQSLFHSGWFVLGLLSQTLIVHMIRTEKRPFIESIASRPVLILTLAIMVVGLVIPFTRFGINIGFQPLPLMYYPWLLVTLIAYSLLIQIVKEWYIKRFNAWL